MNRFRQIPFKTLLALAIVVLSASARASSMACESAFEGPALYKEKWVDRVPHWPPSKASLYKTFGLLIMGEPGAIQSYKAEGRAYADYQIRAQKLEEVRDQILEQLHSEDPQDRATVQLLNDTIFKVAISRSAGEILKVREYYETVRKLNQIDPGS